MTADELATGATPPRINARGRFTLTTGFEADYHSFARREVAIAGYRGPFPADGSLQECSGELFGPLLEQLPATADGSGPHLASMQSANRLIIGWDTRVAGAAVAARAVRHGDLTGWHLTLCVVDRSVRHKGLLRHMLQLLVLEEPADFVSAFVPLDLTDDPEDPDALRRHPVYRAIRSHCPGGHVVAGPHGPMGTTHASMAKALADQLGWSNAPTTGRLVVGDLSGILGAADRWDRLVEVNERARMVVVTGTNGKTSTVEFGRQLGEGVGDRSASFGTLGVVTSRGRLRRPRIGVGANALPELADRLWSTGIESMWVEGFSYALQEGLLDHLAVDVAAFTQVGSDHLGSHRSLIGYWASKERLFGSILRPGGIVVVNPLSAGADRILDIVERRELDLVTTGPEGMIELVDGQLRVGGRRRPCPVSTAQVVMIENLQLAIGCCVALGLDIDRIVAAAALLESPPGRFTELDVATDYRVVIDSAHNADALEASLSELRRDRSGRLLVLIASVGSADETRWEPLGEVADVLADVVVVADESPYRADADRIRAAIRRGCPRSTEIADRRQAIKWLLGQAEPGDIVMIAGRADEDFLVEASGSVPFPTDAALISEALGETRSDDRVEGQQRRRVR